MKQDCESGRPDGGACLLDRSTNPLRSASEPRRVALDAISIAQKSRGTNVHDALRSYQRYSFPQALCNVHHLHELTFLEEELGQARACKMKALLGEMKTEVGHAKALDQQHLDQQVLTALLSRYDELLAEGYLANPRLPPQRNLNSRSEPQDGPSKALLAICWIDSPRTNEPCPASSMILRCRLTIIRRRT